MKVLAANIEDVMREAAARWTLIAYFLLSTIFILIFASAVNLDIVDEPVKPGDYILNHVGFAIRRIPEETIAETLALYEQLMAEAESDAMAGDVRGEIQALGKPGRS